MIYMTRLKQLRQLQKRHKLLVKNIRTEGMLIIGFILHFCEADMLLIDTRMTRLVWHVT